MAIPGSREPVLAGAGSRHLRVVRGGSYFNDTRNARCAYRNRDEPDNRNDNIGFRVVVLTFFQEARTTRRSLRLFRGRGEEWRSPFLAAPGSSRAGHIATAPPPERELWGGALFISPMYGELTSWPNLLRAFRDAARGKRRQPNVAAFEHRLEDNLAELRRDLLTQTYLPGAYKSFYIHEPKRRLISAAPFRDRVVHHTLFNVIEPLFEKGFIADSYANRSGKGTHRALDRCQELSRRFPYVLQLDLRQFFPSIDHAVLRRLLARKLSDPSILWLIDRILKSGEGVLDNSYDMVYFPGDDLFAISRPRGLPIGNLTSQFWANVLLDPIDHFVKRELRCPGYVRYVDDLLFFGHDRRALWVAKREVQARLESLRLTIHPGAHPKPVGEGIPFLGFVVWPESRRLKRRNGVRFRRRLQDLMSAFEAGQLTEDRLSSSLQGWLNHVRYGNTVGLQKALGSMVFDPFGSDAVM